jgi:hypothetical protein
MKYGRTEVTSRTPHPETGDRCLRRLIFRVCFPIALTLALCGLGSWAQRSDPTGTWVLDVTRSLPKVKFETLTVSWAAETLVVRTKGLTQTDRSIAETDHFGFDGKPWPNRLQGLVPTSTIARWKDDSTIVFSSTGRVLFWHFRVEDRWVFDETGDTLRRKLIISQGDKTQTLPQLFTRTRPHSRH